MTWFIRRFNKAKCTMMVLSSGSQIVVSSVLYWYNFEHFSFKKSQHTKQYSTDKYSFDWNMTSYIKAFKNDRIYFTLHPTAAAALLFLPAYWLLPISTVDLSRCFLLSAFQCSFAARLAKSVINHSRLNGLDPEEPASSGAVGGWRDRFLCNRPETGHRGEMESENKFNKKLKIKRLNYFLKD